MSSVHSLSTSTLDEFNERLRILRAFRDRGSAQHEDIRRVGQDLSLITDLKIGPLLLMDSCGDIGPWLYRYAPCDCAARLAMNAAILTSPTKLRPRWSRAPTAALALYVTEYLAAGEEPRLAEGRTQGGQPQQLCTPGVLGRRGGGKILPLPSIDLCDHNVNSGEAESSIVEISLVDSRSVA